MSQSRDPTRPRSPKRERTLIVLSVLLTLLVLFVAAEAGLRILTHFTPYVPKVKGLTYGAGHLSLGSVLEPGHSFSTRIASIHVNARGFRGLEFAMPKPPGVYRIFALGGSSTFGLYPATTADATAYPAVLERLLNAENPAPAVIRYEVVNAGVPGYSTRTSTTNFHARVLHLQPDAIIVTHNNNDLARYGNESGLYLPLMNQFIPHGFVAGLLDHMLGWSFAVQELRYILVERLNFSLFARDKSDSPTRTEWILDTRYLEAFRRDLRNLVILAKANRVRPILASESIAFMEDTDFSRLTEDETKMQFHKPATFYSWVPPEQRYRLFKRYNDIIREVAEQEQALFVDVNAAIPKTPEYYWDYVHLTDRGSVLQAAAIHAALLKAGVDLEKSPEK